MANRTYEETPKNWERRAKIPTPPVRKNRLSDRGWDCEIILLPSPSIRLTNFVDLCTMTITLESRLRYGLLVGFQLYNPDKEDPYYEVVLDILIIRLSIAWI